MKKATLVLALAAILTMAVVGVYAASDVRNTRHNLSTWGGSTYRSNNYGEVCVFCHTPHAANGWPLWNRATVTGTFITYTSIMFGPGAYGGTGTVDTASMLCFSCHLNMGSATNNGVAPTLVNPSNIDGNVQPTFNFKNIHYTAALGLNLRDDHPIGFNYNRAQTALVSGVAKYELFNAAAVSSKMYGDSTTSIFPGDQMTCSSCHDVHGRINPNTSTVVPVLLRRSNQSSMLCWACHNK